MTFCEETLLLLTISRLSLNWIHLAAAHTSLISHPMSPGDSSDVAKVVGGAESQSGSDRKQSLLHTLSNPV